MTSSLRPHATRRMRTRLTLYNIPEQIRVKDPYNTMFVIGFNNTNGIWMTREALNFNTTPYGFALAMRLRVRARRPLSS